MAAIDSVLPPPYLRAPSPVSPSPVALPTNLLLRLRVPAVHGHRLDLRVALDLHLHLARLSPGSSSRSGRPAAGCDDQLLPLHAQVVAVLLRQPPEEDRVGDVALQHVLLGARRRVGGEAVLLAICVAVSLSSTSLNARVIWLSASRCSASWHTTCSAGGWSRRKCGSSATTSPSKTGCKLGGEPERHLDPHAGGEVLAVDQRHCGSLKTSTHCAEQVDVEIDLDARERGVLVGVELLAVDADAAVGDQADG